jgi:glycerol uptake facilitator-like aquaporin
MNPALSPLYLLVLLKDLTEVNQNWVSQLAGSFPWLATLFCLSSKSCTQTNEEKKLPKQKRSATVFSCRVYSILDLSLIERSWQMLCQKLTHTKEVSSFLS